ncbi:MAG: HD domain-containing protein [Flavobacteriales bacterium]|jgi:HD superfamily phosphohydrolase
MKENEAGKSNKRKIINDPVYGFVTFRHDFLLDLIDHPYFQRLRRIAQLGLSYLVYPGAVHNRFQHAIGALHLMQNAIEEIRYKGHEITKEEELGCLCAILFHDIGHGPFSHALEHSIVDKIHHEQISAYLMNDLNEQYNGRFDLAIKIFNDKYHKRFLHQLVSSQLDMDRLDYLARDSFFSGVVEGQVGSERIIKMLDVVNDELVVEEKGIYSIEKFIVARRFMYWQVYLHKTVLSAEFMLVNVLRRAKFLADQGEVIFCSPSLYYFLYNKIGKQDFENDGEALKHFIALDDFDIMSAVKVWQTHEDSVLAELAKGIVNRVLFKIEMSRQPVEQNVVNKHIERIAKEMNLAFEEASYFVISDKVHNSAYSVKTDAIKVKMKDGQILDAAQASDHMNLQALSGSVEKFFLAYKR